MFFAFETVFHLVLLAMQLNVLEQERFISVCNFGITLCPARRYGDAVACTALVVNLFFSFIAASVFLTVCCSTAGTGSLPSFTVGSAWAQC